MIPGVYWYVSLIVVQVLIKNIVLDEISGDNDLNFVDEIYGWIVSEFDSRIIRFIEIHTNL